VEVGMALSQLLQIQNTLFVNLENVTYVEFTGKGGADIHFVGKTKALRLKRGEVGPLRKYISQRNLRQIDEAA
jgi:hypothetical protein